MLGTKYASVIAEGIKKLEYDSVDLKNNWLNEFGSAKVLKNIRSSNKSLDLSWNSIGKSVKLLKPILSNKDSRLQQLNLCKNDLGDNYCLDLIKSLNQNQHLQYLNLSENNLTDKIGEKLSELLFHHS